MSPTPGRFVVIDVGDPDSSAGGARVGESGLDAGVTVPVLAKLETVECGHDDAPLVEHLEETE